MPHVLYEHGETWLNNVDRIKLLIRPPELSGNPTSRVIWQQAGGTGEENVKFVLEVFLFKLASDFFTCRKLLQY
jgi:hypothetical protein